MKKMLVLLIAVIVIALITANCSGPSLVYTGELQSRDTIVIVTQPGFTYEIRVIPEGVNLKDDQAKFLIPPIYTRSGSVPNPLADSDGGSYVLSPNITDQDTIHKFTVIMNGIKQTKLCKEQDSLVFIDCGDGVMTIPCNDAIEDTVINCK